MTTATTYRTHTSGERASSAALPLADSLITALRHEWSLTVAAAPLTHHGQPWALLEPALAGLRSPAEVVTTIDAAGQARTDVLLLALIRLAQRGNSLATRVLVQQFLPKVFKLTHHVRHEHPVTHQEAASEVVETLITRITTYPVEQRPERVAANLSLDTLRAVTKPRSPITKVRVHAIDPFDFTGELPKNSSGELLGPDLYRDSVARWQHDSSKGEENSADLGGLNPDGELTDLVDWAVEHAVMTTDDGALLLSVFAPLPGQVGGHAAAAERLGVSPAAVRQRCSRATRRLSAAVTECYQRAGIRTAA